jgi:hypothetical protein
MPVPTGLRILHAIVFLGFASTAIAATHLELLHLVRSVLHPYNSGTPPQPLPCAVGIAAILLALTLIARFGRRRSVLFISVLMLVAFALSFTTLFLPAPELRSTAGANAKALLAASKVHNEVNDILQASGKAPRDPSTPPEPSPFRARDFHPLAWHVALVPRTDALPDGAQPGWLLLRVADDQSSYSITAVGLDPEGKATVLRDEGGEPIELKGAYNPDTPG